MDYGEEIIVSKELYDELVKKLTTGAIGPHDVLEGLGISEASFGGCGAFRKLDDLLALWKIENDTDQALNEIFIRELKKHIRENGRFDDEPEPSKPKTIEERKKEIEAILKNDDASQDGTIRTFELEMELLSLMEKRISALEDEISHLKAKLAIY